MAKFKSYASPVGFNPIQVPDQTSKYLQQGQNYMRAMERAMDFDIQSRNRYAQAMANAQQLEASNRDMIFKLDERNRQRVQDQIQENYQKTIRDADNQARDQIKTLETLASFSNTAFEAVNTFYQKREEGIKLGVHQAIYATGIDLKGLQEIHKLDRNLTDQALNENQFIKGLVEKGGSIQHVRYLMKHSNAKYWNENRELAERAGAGFATYSTENWDTKYKFVDEEISLSEAMATNRPEVVENILSQQRAEYFKESGLLNLNPKIAAAYVHPQIKAYENQVMQATNAASRKLIDEQTDENLLRGFEQLVSTGGPAAVIDRINSLPSGAQRAAEMQLLTKYFELKAGSAEWKDGEEVWKQLLNQPTDESGMTFYERHKNNPKILAVAQAFKDARRRDLQDYNLQRQESLTRYQIAETELAQILRANPGGFSEADVDAADARLRELFPELPGVQSDVLNSLRKNESTNALYEKSIRETLDKLRDSGQLTEERMNQMGIPGRIADEYRAAARQIGADRKSNDQFKPQLESLSIIAQSPPQVAAKVVGGKYHWTVPLMEQRLHNEFIAKYSELRAAGDPNAVNAAFSFVQSKFAAQSKNPKFFTSEGGYASFAATKTPSTASSARMQWVQGRIKDLGTKALDSNGAIFTISELNTIEQNSAKPNFKMDPMAEYVGRMMGVDPFTVINRQRVAAGLPMMQMPESKVRFNAQASPELQRKLSSYGTPEISSRAMMSTRQFDETRIPKGYGPLVVEAAQKAGISPVFVAAFAEAENQNWDPNALSMGGAAAGVGLMQLSQEYHGPGATVAERERALKDPRLNLTLGAGILRNIYQKYGNWKDSIYVWNMGETGYKRWVDAGRPNTEQAGYAKGLYERFEKARAKYGDVSALQSRGTMRTSMQRFGRPSFERPSSVVFETSSGQPGVDLYFESKRFPAVLDGVVKDISREPGYGNYVVIESIDPSTGQKVDVLYGHLADGISLRPGQRISAGDIIGTQGGTGNVQSVDGTIASIDFLAPAPRGSKSMTPYANFNNLRQFIVSQMQ